MATQNSFQISWLEPFLAQGALFSSGEDVHLFFGDYQRKSQYPGQGFVLYYTDFFLHETQPWVVFEHHIKLSRLEFADFLAQLDVQGPLELIFQPPSFEEFALQYQKIQEQLSRGQLSKAVPMVFSDSHPLSDRQQHNLVQYLLQQVAKYDDLYLYGIWGAGFSKNMLGATPEILFKWQSHHLQTMALAGTCAATGIVDQSHPLLRSSKDTIEHQIVVDGIVSELQALGRVEVGPRHVVAMSTLEHLRTLIRVDIDVPPKFEELVARLHPTPALGVFPRTHEANAFFEKLDQLVHRGPFGSPFALRYDHDIADCLVAIRGVQWQDKMLRVGTGCGVVKESQLTQEWDEVLVKQAAITKMLNL